MPRNIVTRLELVMAGTFVDVSIAAIGLWFQNCPASPMSVRLYWPPVPAAGVPPMVRWVAAA